MMSLLTFGRRQLHTIITRQLIKPSSPTPPRRKTYNLSVFDQISPDVYVPMVAFYPNSDRIHTVDLKNSLSQILTQYYPFAGTLAKTTPTVVDCNDHGVEFIEAENSNLLSDFLQNMQYADDLDQLFPNGLVWSKKLRYKSENGDDKTRSPLAVQVNSFSCGGIAVAVSLSHKVADGTSLCNFFNDWAVVTRKNVGPQSIDPRFISSENVDLSFQGFSVDKSVDDCVTRSFVFPNSKLTDLKRRVAALMTTVDSERRITELTRLEALNWLLYSCAVKAAIETNRGSFRPTGLVYPINMRSKMVEPLPATSVGNLFKISLLSTNNEKELLPSSFIGKLRELKMEVEGIKDIRTAEIGATLSTNESTRTEEQSKIDEYYLSTSL